MNITVIGTVYVDIKGFPLNGADFVPSGRNAGDCRYFHGGVGRNIAEDVAALGEDVTFISLIDKSGIASDVVARLKARGISTDYVRTTEDGMGTWLAIFDPAGEVCANISKRPNLLPICDILTDDGDDIFSCTDGVLLEMDIDEEILAACFHLAEKHDVPVYGVISNITLAKERLNYIQKTSCFICNQQEAGVFFDANTEGLSPAEMLALLQKKKAERGVSTMVVTMDEHGSVYADASGNAGHCPAKQVNVINTTGAGDAFFAGCSTGLIRGEALAAACELGRDIATEVIQSEDNVYCQEKG